MSLAGATARTFSGSRVIENTIGAIRRNPKVFGLVVLIWVAAPQALIQWLGLGRTLTSPVSAQTTGLGAAGMILNLAASAVLIWGVWTDLSGRRPSWDELMRRGFNQIGKVFLVGFCAFVGMMAGFALLIVPGVMLMVAWSAAIPVQVVEKTGVFGAFRRSADLTRGHRWQVFGLILIYGVVTLVAAVVVGLLINQVFFGSALRMTAVDSSPLRYVGVALSAVVGGLYTLIGAVFTAALYYELRLLKDGVGTETLSKVFE